MKENTRLGSAIYSKIGQKLNQRHKVFRGSIDRNKKQPEKEDEGLSQAINRDKNVDYYDLKHRIKSEKVTSLKLLQVKIQSRIRQIDEQRHQREEFLFLIGGSGNITPAANSLSFNQRQRQDILMSKLKQKQLKTVNKKRQTSAFKSLNRSQKNGLKNNDSLMTQTPSQQPPPVGTYRPNRSQVEQNNITYTFSKQMKFIEDQFDCTENSLTAKEIKMGQFSHFKLCSKVVKALDKERCDFLKLKGQEEIQKQINQKIESRASSALDSGRNSQKQKKEQSIHQFKEKVLQGKKELDQEDLIQIHFGSQAWKKRPFSGINQLRHFMRKSSKAQTKASSNIGETSYQVSNDYTLIQSFPERFIVKEELLEDQLKGKSLVNFDKQLSREESVQPTSRPISSYSKQAGRGKLFSRSKNRLQSAHMPITELTKEFKFNSDQAYDEEPRIKIGSGDTKEIAMFDKEIPLTTQSVNQNTHSLPKKRLVTQKEQEEKKIQRVQTEKKTKGGFLMAKQVSRDQSGYRSQGRRRAERGCQPEYEPNYDHLYPHTNCCKNNLLTLDVDFNKMKKGRDSKLANDQASRLHSVDTKSLDTSFTMLAHHKNFAKQSKRVIDIGVKGELQKNIDRENENFAFIEQFRNKKR